MHTHIRKQVYRRLLHIRIGIRSVEAEWIVVIAAQSPGPADRTATKNQRPARRAVERHMMDRVSGSIGRSLIEQQVRSHAVR